MLLAHPQPSPPPENKRKRNAKRNVDDDMSMDDTATNEKQQGKTQQGTTDKGANEKQGKAQQGTNEKQQGAKASAKASTKAFMLFCAAKADNSSSFCCSAAFVVLAGINVPRSEGSTAVLAVAVGHAMRVLERCLADVIGS